MNTEELLKTSLEHLVSAKREIIALRSQNQLMAARLEMFDNVMTVLNTEPARRGYGMSAPELVYEIDKLLAAVQQKTKGGLE